MGVVGGYGDQHFDAADTENRRCLDLGGLRVIQAVHDRRGSLHVDVDRDDLLDADTENRGRLDLGGLRVLHVARAAFHGRILVDVVGNVDGRLGFDEEVVGASQLISSSSPFADQFFVKA